MKKLKVASLFTGIGAWEEALKYLNIEYELSAYCEIDKWASTAYTAIHNESEDKNLGDITTLKEDEIKEIDDFDVLFYSPPCQAFSVAGRQEGFNDERGILFFDAMRIIEIKKPKYAFMENVKGLVGKRFKNEFKDMLQALEDAGYNNYYQVLNAKDYGIPQNRERVFIVSVRKDVDDNSFKFPEGFKSGLRLRDMLEDEVDEKYYISDERVEKLLSELKDKGLPNQEISYCIDANYHKGTNIEGFINKRRRQLVEVRPALTPDKLNKRQQGRRFKENEEEMFTITSQDRHGVLLGEIDNSNTDKIIQINESKHFSQRVYNKEGIAPTISAGNSGGGKEPCKILCEVRSDEGLRFFKDENIGALRAKDSGGEKRLIESKGDGVKLKFIGGIGNKDWADDGKKFSRNYPQGNRVYDSDGLACSQTSQGGGIGSFTGLYLEKNQDDKLSTEGFQFKYHAILNKCKCLGVFISSNLETHCPYCKKIDETIVTYLNEDETKAIIKHFADIENGKEKEDAKLIVKLRLEGGMWDKVTEDIKRVYGLEGLCPTITTCQGGHRQPKVLKEFPEYKIRKLTPSECWRLMGFRDDSYKKARQALIDKYYNGKDRSASQMYKMAGNSIVVNVVMEILKNFNFK